MLKITQQDLGLKPGHNFHLALVPKFFMLLLCGPLLMVTVPCRACTWASSAWTHPSAATQGQASARRPPPSTLRLVPVLVPAPPRPPWRQGCCPPAGVPGTPATQAPPQAGPLRLTPHTRVAPGCPLWTLCRAALSTRRPSRASRYLHVHGDAAVRGEGKGVFRHRQDQRVPLAVHQGGAAEGHSGLPGTRRVLAEEEEVQPRG